MAEPQPRPNAEPPVSSKLYYSISEAAQMLDVAPHVLRYWETQFTMLRPRKGRSGSRMYQRRDIELLTVIKQMLYDEGLTIAGAQRKLLHQRKAERTAAETTPVPTEAEPSLKDLVSQLRTLAADLRRPPRPRSSGR
jgi:DNA-binding transcriptional MerR regulator